MLRLRTSLCIYICTQKDNWMWSLQFTQLQVGYTKITPGIYKYNRKDPYTISTSLVPVWHCQLAQNPAAQKYYCMCIYLCKFPFNNTDKQRDFNFLESYSFQLVVMDTTSSPFSLFPIIVSVFCVLVSMVTSCYQHTLPVSTSTFFTMVSGI